MERGKRRTSSEAGLEDHAESSRRVSTAASQLPDAGGFRGLNQQYPDDFLVNLLTLQFQALNQQYPDDFLRTSRAYSFRHRTSSTAQVFLRESTGPSLERVAETSSTTGCSRPWC